MSDHLKLINQLKRHEGFSSKPYICPGGYLTIGYGRNLDANGITKEEAERLLRNDIEQAELDAFKFLGQNVESMSAARRGALINMAFNLGAARLGAFEKFRAALLDKDWERAAKEMEGSKWYSQVGNRAKQLVIQMRTGEWR